MTMRLVSWLYSLLSRLRLLFHPHRADQDLREELREHLDRQIQQNLRRGMSPQEARRSALRDLGGLAQIEQQVRDAVGGNLLRDFILDLRYGLRQLRRAPGFSVLAILCLTLAIGANAAVFSWLEGILFRPYPAVAHQNRLVAIAGTARGEIGATEISWPDFLDLRRACTLCEDSFVSKISSSTLSIGDHAQTAIGSIVSSNYFDAIGVRPILGRGFEPDEDTGNHAHPVVVISYQLWHDRFNADPAVVGKTQRLNNVPHTIIGVAPQGFNGTFVGWAMQFWVPVSMEEAFESGGYKLEDRNARWVEAYLRLRPGITRAQAQQQVSALAAQLERNYPVSNRGRGLQLWPLWQTPFNNAGTLLPTLELMTAVVAFVLLIACANVGNLLMVRALARRHEMSVRLAIGAARSRLFRQLLTEGLLLATFGTIGGLLLAFASRRALVLLLPARSGVSMYLPGAIDGRVMAASAGLCIVVTLLVGLVPAFQTRNLDLAIPLRAESSAIAGGSRGRNWLRAALVVLQVALSFILLIGAALLLRSLQKIRTANPGFSTTSVVTTNISLVAAGYDAQRAKVFQDELIDRVRALPAVDSAAFARLAPLGYKGYSSTPIAVDGYQPPLEERPSIDYNQIGPGYFATLGIPVLSGRDFTPNDDENAPLVAIVNRTMVNRCWSGQDPTGRRLQVNGKWARVIAVVADSRYQSMREAPTPFFYIPLRQDFTITPALFIRTSQPVQSILPELLGQVHALDRNLALYEMITLREQVNRSTSAQRVAVTLVSILGSLALLLAGIGLYGVMSYAVAQSSRELGLRMALGAGAANLLRLVLARGLRLTATGILCGALAGLVLTRWLGNLLYDVSPRDPLVYGLALIVMTASALAACLLPAWRAARTDPARVLRS
jgi:predicted permease